MSSVFTSGGGVLGICLIAAFAAVVAEGSGTVPIGTIVPDVMPGDVELAVIPRPKAERMGDTMIEVGRVLIVAPDWDQLRAGRAQLTDLFGGESNVAVAASGDSVPDTPCDTLVLIGHPGDLGAFAPHVNPLRPSFAELAAMPNADQGYVLSVGPTDAGKRNMVTILAPDLRGAFYGVQTLKQLVVARNGKRYVRTGEIRDWPTFAGRGSKRNTNPWVYAFKSNLQYENGGDAAAQDHFLSIWIAGIFPVAQKKLDATPEGIARQVERMQQLHARGATDFRVHVDDQPMALNDETATLFNGDYHAALAHFLTEFYGAMKAEAPDATLYFCAQPYWTQTPYTDYARRLWAGRTPPQDFAVAINGPQVTSTPIAPDDVAYYSRAFGASKPALIVDWHGRDKSFGPTEPRTAALAKHAVGIAPGMGTATMWATRLDWGWNPEAYDPDRSLMLACREFAGFENWKDLYEMVAALEYAAPGITYMPRDQALNRMEKSIDRCGTLLAKLKALPDGGMNGRVELPRNPAKGHPGNVVDQIEVAWKQLAEEKRGPLRQYGYREATAVRTGAPPVIDGKLNDDAWQAAPVATAFIASGKALAENQQTSFRCLYDDAHLTVGLRMVTPTAVDLNTTTTVLGMRMPPGGEEQDAHDLPGIFALHGWHAISLMLDPQHTHLAAFEFQLDAAGRRLDALFDIAQGTSPNGVAWNSGWKSAVSMTAEGWTAELQIPWTDLGVTPRKGMALGLQIWRSGKGMKSCKWSEMPRWWGVQSPPQFGHLILD